MDIFELMDIGENSEIEFKKAKNSVPKQRREHVWIYLSLWT